MRVYEFTASWCQPCKSFGKTLAKWQAAHPETKITVVKLDPEDPALAKQADLFSDAFGVQGIPALVFTGEPDLEPGSPALGDVPPPIPAAGIEYVIKEGGDITLDGLTKLVARARKALETEDAVPGFGTIYEVETEEKREADRKKREADEEGSK